MIDAKTDRAVGRLLDRKKLAFPRKPRVVDLRWETDLDWTGDPCVRVWLIFDDATTEEELAFERIEPYMEKVRKAVDRSDLGLIPYLSIRTRSEQAEIDAGIPE